MVHGSIMLWCSVNSMKVLELHSKQRHATVTSSVTRMKSCMFSGYDRSLYQEGGAKISLAPTKEGENVILISSSPGALTHAKPVASSRNESHR
jgi:hypothetical protein